MSEYFAENKEEATGVEPVLANEKKEKQKKSYASMRYSFGSKILIFLLAMVAPVITVCCVVGAIVMSSQGVYSKSQESYVQEKIDEQVENYVDQAVKDLIYIGKSEAKIETWLQGTNIAQLEITDAGHYVNVIDKETGECLRQEYNHYTLTITEDPLLEEVNEETSYTIEGFRRGKLFEFENMAYKDYDLTKESAKQYSFTYYRQGKNLYQDYVKLKDPYDIVMVTCYLPGQLLLQDQCYAVSEICNYLYSFQYTVYVVGFLMAIVSVIAFIMLMSVCGHRRGVEGIDGSIVTAIPVDVMAIAVVAIEGSIMAAVSEMPVMALNLQTLLLFVAIALVMWSIALGCIMSLATRMKLGKWYQNSVIFYLCKLLIKLLKWIFKQFLRFVQWNIMLIKLIPLIPKTVAVIAIVSVAELFSLLLSAGEFDTLFILWLLEKMIVLPLVFLVLKQMLVVEKGAQELAKGNLEYQIDDAHLMMEIKEHAKNLNSIGEGMSIAVAEKIKSEHMKTELITNVSHDLKTPLTSIINYSDLILREECENEKIAEYAEVLHRQSGRLKHLIEDLVEASKASTGNLEVELSPMELDVFLTQVAGEYEQRFEDVQLSLVMKKPEKQLEIMADGRRLYRVFDNLLGNICKYALPGSRVYITLEEHCQMALVSIKNISKDPLNVSEEELMERFTRGDVSRHTEGNGLGLSIARSLTQLQNGTLDLTIDGDLFKVTLCFPLMVTQEACGE